MKELSIKEKAQRYDEALVWMQDLYPTMEGAMKEDAKHYFPQLKENKSEKIRKMLVRFFSNEAEYNGSTYGIPDKDILDWLEKQGHTDNIIEKAKTGKQRIIITETEGRTDIDWDTRSLEDVKKLLECGLQYINTELEKQDKQILANSTKTCEDEQKSDDKIEPKFKVGDWVIFNEHHNSVYQVEKIDNYRYYLRHYLGGTLSIRFDSELIRKWTLQDAKNGDVLASNSSTFLFSQEYMAGKPKAHCGIMNGFFIVKPEGCWTNEKIYPATKEQRDAFFAKMKEAGYEWDAERLELKKIEQKSTDRIESTPHNYITPNQQFFQWIYDRLINVHNENPNVDYMLSLKERIENMQKPAWSEEDESIALGIEQIVNCASLLNIAPDKLDKVRNWLKVLKNRVTPQLKQEWSVEDERMLGKCIDAASEYYSPEEKQPMKDWLKSIKNRYT